MRVAIESLETRRLFAANLVVNGDFENPLIGGGASGQGYTDYGTGSLVGSGWKVASGSVDVVSNTAGFTFSSAPAHGKQYVDMCGGQPGSITQTVTTVVGHRYILKFAYTATPFADPSSPATRQMAVTVGGKSIVTLSKSETGETPTAPGWVYVSYLITATSTSTAITFTNKTAGVAGMALDDVSFIEQPFGTASISGQVFADGNGDGIKGTDAIGLAGWTVFIDTNGNGKLDTFEYKTTTDHLGNYSFTGLATGTYKVTLVSQTGWKLTTSAILTASITTAGQKITGELFGEQPI